MATPFEISSGLHQQRRRDTDSAEGEYVFELGHNRHLDVYLVAGDRQRVEQTFVMAYQTALIRTVVRIEEADDVPAGASWLLTVRLNGDVRYQRTLQIAKRKLVLSDIGVPMSAANSPPSTNTLSFQLELVA